MSPADDPRLADALLVAWVPGEPESGHRARWGNGHMHHDRREDRWRALLDLSIARAWRGRREPLTGALEVAIRAYFAPPKCRAGRGMEPHLVKPDADNLSKPPLDAMKRLGIYRDDTIVAHLDVKKYEVPSLPGGEPCGEIGMSIVIRRARSWAELGGDPVWEASVAR